MKKLFTLLFAVVTVAAFALPTAQKAKKLQPQKTEAKIEMKAQMADMYTGKAGMMKDFSSGVDTMYMTPVGTFFSAFFPYSGSLFYSYNLALAPGNTELTWTNISTGIASDNFDWVYYNPGIDEEYLTQVEGEKDLVCTFPNYPGWWISPMLYADAYNQADDEAGNYFTWGGALLMGGKAEIDVLGDGTTLTNMYQFSPRADYNDLSLTQGMTAGQSEDIGFYTNMVNRYVPDADFAKIVNFVEFFNYPGHPYTFSRIQFYARCTAEAGQTLTAKVCRVDDGMIDMDNPIATAEYEFPEAGSDEDLAIDFFFEKEDPDLGLTEEDWIVVDGDICIVIDGVDMLQEISPFLNAMTQAADNAHDELYSQFCNGYAQWDYYDGNELIESRFHPVHCGWYWGSGDDVSLPENLLLSINAQFAYIETVADNATEYTIPAEGGEYTLNLKASEPYDAWAVDDMPDWISIEAEDEFETQEDGTEEYTGYTTLTINVQPNNNGQVVYTLPGTSFTIKVGEAAPAVPGDVDGDGVVTAGDITALYNYLLNNDDSALVNGDQDGDGNITAGDITLVYNILLGN